MAFLSRQNLQEILQTFSVLQWLPVYIILGEWTPRAREHVETGQERGQESTNEEGSKEIIWLVPSLWEGLCLLTQDMATVEFTGFLSFQLRGVKARNEAVVVLV